MLFVRDKGRMCNNILQYGHVYAWACEHGRRSVSMRFAYKYQYFHICHTAYHNALVYVLAKYGAKLGLLPVASFNNAAGNPEAQQLMDSRKWLVVEGWQVRYYQLFLKYKRDILQLFSFDQSIESHTSAIIETSAADADILLGVHIRRGDYRTWQGGRYFFSDQVYIDYIRQFCATHKGRVHVFVCGNDPALDRQKYIDSLPGVGISFPAGNPGEDLCLLSHCHYLIGAPSTFSLVASMYHNVPLCWMKAALTDGGKLEFDVFDNLFRHII